MKKFAFSLQSVLNLQLKIEDQEKQAFREASMKLMEEEDKLRDLMRQKEGYEEDLKEALSGILDVIEVNNIKHSIDVMKSRIRTQMIAVHVAEKNVEAARIRLTEAMVNRKTYEKMREKAFEEYKRETEAEESKEIDELVSFRHAVND
ncbi:MAG: flagellar export protein FliJ [Lachnospiraceae bacterium]|nr:flagellar export protein FliJ [Lachnospiraceae bacterium]MBR5789591.1 flagellar export protein FliJ [Lachnospiraceae bacterium]